MITINMNLKELDEEIKRCKDGSEDDGMDEVDQTIMLGRYDALNWIKDKVIEPQPSKISSKKYIDLVRVEEVMKDIDELLLHKFLEKYDPYFMNPGSNNPIKNYRHCLKNAVLLKKYADNSVPSDMVNLRTTVKELKKSFPKIISISNGTLYHYMRGYGFMTMNTLNRIKEVTGIEFYNPDGCYILKK